MKAPTYCLIALAALWFSPKVSAVEVVLVNLDKAGDGLNDAAAAVPTGGNPGTTVGEQRQIVYRFALDMFGALLNGVEPLRVRASFAPLRCDAGKTVLGNAAAVSSYYNFSGAPLRDTKYPVALANALRGTDNAPGEDDIQSHFNGIFGSPKCKPEVGWYFGLDGRTPDGYINFLNVVTHELVHGLGFHGDSTTNRDAKFIPRIYDRFVREANGSNWVTMTNAQRAAGLVSDRLVWTGPNVTHEAGLVLEEDIGLVVSAPARIAGVVNYASTDIGPSAASSAFTGKVVRGTYGAVVDGNNVVKYDGCEAITNVAEVANNIALIDRGGGSCFSALKAYNAQVAGAAAVIISNNNGGPAPELALSATPAPVTIPVITISQADGNRFVADLAGMTINGFGAFADNHLAGTLPDGVDAARRPISRVKLYAPNPASPGSTLLHFDTRLKPNALMEPSNTKSLIAQAFLDLTPALLADIGWPVNRGNLRLLDCNTTVPVSLPGGLVPGANAMANVKMCARYAKSVAEYRSCTGRYVQSRMEAKLFTPLQAVSLKKCLLGSKAETQYRAWH
ncbi:PA domain-containing protein [Lysobacter antibioticus]|uniref:PA domain-containing protein n=1 Tax=Lysobacter antibioticus TaxID=84531 RepID=UPI0009DEB85C|nr:PA domain-containing protein [Lysobacter antibioticus]